MSMRISSAAFCVFLAGCGPTGADDRVLANTGTIQRGDAVPANRIACAPAGTVAFAPICSLDREQRAEELVLTLHNPDGGFHRLLVTRDGRGVIAADGAAPARVTLIDADHIEVAIGGDRYRLPATIGPHP